MIFLKKLKEKLKGYKRDYVTMLEGSEVTLNNSTGITGTGKLIPCVDCVVNN